LQNSELGFNSALQQKSKYYALRSLGETVQSSRGRRPQSKNALISRRNTELEWKKTVFQGCCDLSSRERDRETERETHRERERKLERKRIIVLN
jgi:hypothetical protein